jgi:hypothetical protein
MLRKELGAAGALEDVRGRIGNRVRIPSGPATVNGE